MSTGRDELLARARAAAERADWTQARARYEEAVALGPHGESLDGLAQVLVAHEEYGHAIERFEQAFTAFLAAGQDLPAAMCARSAGYLYGVVHGNATAMRGWMTRAVRIVEAAADCPQRARIELTRATVATDPAARREHLDAAIAIARRHGDTGLEADALSLRGLHLVAAGDVASGMAMLDEGLASVAAGEVRDVVRGGSGSVGTAGRVRPGC